MTTQDHCTVSKVIIGLHRARALLSGNDRLQAELRPAGSRGEDHGEGVLVRTVGADDRRVLGCKDQRSITKRGVVEV